MWFYLSLFSVVALATAEISQQYLLNRKNAFSPRTSSVLTSLSSSLIILPVIFLFGFQNQLLAIFEPVLFSKLLVVAFISSIAAIFYFKSFQVKNISISAIFVSFSVIVSTLFGIIFLAESASYLKFFGIALVLASITILNYRNVAIEKNHWYGLLAGFIYGMSYTLDKNILSQIHPLIYIFWLFLLMGCWGFFLGRNEPDQTKKRGSGCRN
jgi:drug/metabolite transporter (DMT)-like permease